MTVDVVCKMEIEEAMAELCSVFQGRTYCFCFEGCRAEFERNREDYLIITESEAFRDADSEGIKDDDV